MPPKRGVSAYFLFCDERRSAARAACIAELGEENVNVTTVAKRLGAEWRELSDQQRCDYKALAASAALKDDDEEDGPQAEGEDHEKPAASPSKNGEEKQSCSLPLNAVKRVMRLDDDVSGLSAAAVTATARAAELILELLVQEAYSIAVKKKRRKLLFADVEAVLLRDQRWSDMGIADLIERSPAFEGVRAARAGAGPSRPKPMEEDPKAQKITSFFGA